MSGARDAHLFDLGRHPFQDSGTGVFAGTTLAASRHQGFGFNMGGSGAHEAAGVLEPRAAHGVVILLQGHLTLTANDAAIEMTAGDVALIGPGTAVDWKAGPGSRWVVNSYGDAEGEPGLAAVNPQMALDPGPSGAPDLLLTAAPTCKRGVLAAASDGLWSCGLWQATPYARRAIRYDYYEMMLLLEGSVLLESPSGETFTHGAGDLIVIAPGAEFGWRNDETVRKFWSVFKPGPENNRVGTVTKQKEKVT